MFFSLLVLLAERWGERERDILVQISNGWGIQINAAVWMGRVILVGRVRGICLAQTSNVWKVGGCCSRQGNFLAKSCLRSQSRVVLFATANTTVQHFNCYTMYN